MPSDVQKILLKVQALVESALPRAQRCLSYNMPAFRDGNVFFYFAGFKNHLGIYPPLREDTALLAELAPYANEMGTLAFKYKARPLSRAMVSLRRLFWSAIRMISSACGGRGNEVSMPG